MVYINNIDDSKLVLHEGESIVRVKYLSAIKQEDKSGSLLNIKDEDLPK